MKRWKRSSLLVLFLGILFLAAKAQVDGYLYRRPLHGVTQEWHQLNLNEEILSRINTGKTDLRVISIQGDTQQVPYILQSSKEMLEWKQVPFRLLNESRRNDWYYITLACDTGLVANDISLDFEQENFDWRVNLEGAERLGEWATILNDIRILSIKNQYTSYSFSRLRFSNCKFPFYRISIRGSEKPILKSIVLNQELYKPGQSLTYEVRNFQVLQHPERKQTEVRFRLRFPAELTGLQLYCKSRFDYFREALIESLVDSIQTDAGWTRRYSQIRSASFSSNDYSPFTFSPLRAQEFRVLIQNGDNPPLDFESVSAFGPAHNLMLRFPAGASEQQYYLYYGNANAQAPEYDINAFPTKIPKQASALAVGEEEQVADVHLQVDTDYKSTKWIWFVLIPLLAFLGLFAFRMLKPTE